ncbi:MAG TPA: DUF222 domain-containing protein [Actinoplanes sp.]|nr:DUF222 domain-containing protein [Actinoplanes sp.]
MQTGALSTISKGLAELGESPVWTLADDELVTGFAEIHRIEQQTAAVRLAWLGELDSRGLPGQRGAATTVSWLRSVLLIGANAASRMLGLARGLRSATATAAALGAGEVNVEQAHAVVETLKDLPDEVKPETVEQVEAAMLEHAGVLNPAELRVLGTRVLAHVAPEVAEEADRRALEAAEARAVQKRGLHLSADDAGGVSVRGSLDPESAAIVRAALDPLTKPCRADGGLDGRTAPQRRADALTEICRAALGTDLLSTAGGEPITLVVTAGFDALTRQLGAGMLDAGIQLSAETVRRLACDATVLPAILGGQSQVLDLGRQRRLFTGAVRRALNLRDQGCAFPGCDRPINWCHGHHIISWLDNGNTDLDNGVLLCGHHHVRHEALDYEGGVRPSRRGVAAARLKLGAA